MAIKIYVDAGHNPKNPNAGAEGNGLREQDLVYTVGVELGALLAANPNFEVRLSRPTPDTQVGGSVGESLRMRTDAANRWGADYFLSLHTNAAESPAATGSEALVYAAPSGASAMAESILRFLTEKTGLRNRGVLTRPTLWVLKKTKMPAVLVELGFITNPRDAALMKNRPALFAEGIYEGILAETGVSASP